MDSYKQFMEKEAQGRVSSIQIFAEKGRPGEKKDTITLIEGVGISGDRHADGSDKQISILMAEVREWMNLKTDPGLCFARYKENLAISGMDVEQFRSGARFWIGSAELEITSSSKRCFPQCRYFSEGRECLLSTSAFYARVVKSGEVSTGDSVIFRCENVC